MTATSTEHDELVAYLRGGADGPPPLPKLPRGSATPRVRLAIYRKSNFCCASCGMQFNPPDKYDGKYALFTEVYSNRAKRMVLRILELDHIIPYSRGGAWRIDNLQALCTGCNVSKGARIE